MQHSRMFVRTLWLEGGQKLPKGLRHHDLSTQVPDDLFCRGVGWWSFERRGNVSPVVVLVYRLGRMASFAGADIKLLRDILLREQTRTPDTFQVVGRVLPGIRSLHDVLGRVLNVWDVYRSDLLELNAMLCIANMDMFSRAMEEDTYDSMSWQVERFGYETLLPLRQLGLTARLCCVGLARRPSEILRFLDELQDIIVFLRHELLPAIRRYEPWHRLMTSCELSLEASCQTGIQLSQPTCGRDGSYISFCT